MNTQETLTGVDLEHAVLGASLLSKDALGYAIDRLSPEDFADTKCRLLFNTLSDMYMHEIHADIVTVAEELGARGLLERVGGKRFVVDIAACVPSSVGISRYTELLRDRTLRRKIGDAGRLIADMSSDFTKPVPVTIERATKLLFDAGQNRSAQDFRLARELVGPVFANILERTKVKGEEGGITGYASGWSDMDSFMGGFQPGSLNIVAARPSMGKTAFAMNIAQFGGGEANPPVLVFSLEMPAEQLVQRMLAAQCNVDLSRLSRGVLTSEEFTAIRKGADAVARRNIYINDASQLSAVEFRTRCRRFKTKHPELALVIVDYLQLMSSGEHRTEGRQQEVSDISRMLKAVARETNCPVIALSQLSREAEKRPDKKPQLSDLRDSGAIEQDADTVILLYREDYYGENENTDLRDSKADIRIAKNRNGSTGMFSLTFKRDITRFYNFGEDPSR